MFFTVLQSQNVGSGGVLGNGAITVAGPTLVASGAHVAPVLGSGGITIGGPTAAGSGNHAAPAHTGTGAVAIGGPAAAGSGAHTAPGGALGTGALAIAGPLVAGLGQCQGPAVAGALPGGARDRTAGRPALLGGLRAEADAASRPAQAARARPALTSGRRR